MRRRQRCRSWLLGILLLSASLLADDRPRIAIIIDDLGNERRAGVRAIEVAQAVYRSTREHATIKLPLE